MGARKSSNRAHVQVGGLGFGLYDGLLPLSSDCEMKGKAKPGPTTLTDIQLITRRTAWVFMLETNWGAVGWELKCARSADAIHEAFRPLASKYLEQALQPFLRDSTENTDWKALRKTEAEYFAAALQESKTEHKAIDQRNLVREAQSAVSELTGKNRKQINEQIIWRTKNVRGMSARLNRAKVRRAELALRERTANRREGLAAKLASATFECDKLYTELTAEKGIVQDLQTRLEAITAVRRQTAAKILRERKTVLAAIERRALDSRTALERLRIRLLDQQAYFCRVELLKFIRPNETRRKRYAHTPRNLANALAGLPDMTCGQSAKRCAKYPYKIAPGMAAQLFELLDRTWRRADSRNRKSPLQLFQQAMAKLPKTRIVGVDGKRKKVENDFRRHLEENWAYLKPAIEDGVRTSTHPSDVPYRIAAKFHERLSKPRTQADILLAQQERLRSSDT